MTGGAHTDLELYGASGRLVAHDDEDSYESAASRVTWTATYTGWAWVRIRDSRAMGGDYRIVSSSRAVCTNERED